MAKEGQIRVGIGGWTFKPWRGTFYPTDLPQARELAYTSRLLTTIEINATFYRSQTPATYAKWANETPDGFLFSVKGPRAVTHRRVLADAAESISWFFKSGISELGDRLGPILWQLAPTKKFDEADLRKFLELLPSELGGRRLRHVLEVRHNSFVAQPFIALLRRFSVPIVFAEHPSYPALADSTGDFIYARLQKGTDEIATAYPPDALDDWARRARQWAQGATPRDLPLVDPANTTRGIPRDVFLYFIHEGKVRAPAAAVALLERLNAT